MGWYRVTKNINGRLYDYWQRTERQGKNVKTFNKYIGPHKSIIINSAIISAPRTLAQSLDGVRTVRDIEREIASIQSEIDTTARAIDSGLPDDKWKQAQDSLTEKYAQIRQLEGELATSLKHHLDTAVLPLLQQHGVTTSPPNQNAFKPQMLDDKAQAILDAAPKAPRSETILYARKITELTGAPKVTAAAMLEALQYSTDRERLFGKQVYIYALFDKDMVSLANYRRAQMIGVSGLDPELPTLTEAVNARIRALRLTKRRADNLRRYILHEYGDYLSSDTLRRLAADQSHFFNRFDQYERTVAEHHELLASADYTPSAPEAVESEPKPRREDYTIDEWSELQAARRDKKREFDAGMAAQAAKRRKAKRNSKGTGAINPFLGQAIKLHTKIPTFSEATKLIAKEGGYANMHSLPAENAYAAEQFGKSAALTASYIYYQATKRGIRINDWLRRFDAETDPAKRADIVAKFIDTVSAVTKRA